MSNIRLICGDCIDVMLGLDAGSVHTCVTSPPYWGLRDYGTARWEGGDSECDHIDQRKTENKARTKPACSHGGMSNKIDCDHQTAHLAHRVGYREKCALCGAIRIDRQIGLESTIDEYVAKMVEVFREVRRVLRDDGTLWLNMGDSYVGGGQRGNPESRNHKKQRNNLASMFENQPEHPSGLKPKDLVGMPWRVAFALQADGWYLRSDIIWHKPNPMPESVTDRPTKSHEYIFLMAKSERYYYDGDAISEESIRSGEIVNLAEKSLSKGQSNGSGRPYSGNGLADFVTVPARRNKRSVWTVATRSFNGAHFATFPPKLIEPCILAGAPEGGSVLDPFSGAGTTGLVCLDKGRDYIGIELSPVYHAMAEKRIADHRAKTPLFELI